MTAQSPPRVLVLLATCNGVAWIERQLDTVLVQQGVEIRVDVRDDDSIDATRDAVARRAEVDRRVRLVEDHAGSGSAAGNFFRLIRQANLQDADFVAFCDQDDEWRPDKLLRAVRCLSDSGADGYSAAVLSRWSDGREKVLAQKPTQRLADYLFEGAGQGCTFVMTARLFEYARATTASSESSGVRYHDWTIYAISRAKGLSWHFDPEPALTYRQHASNDTGARDSLAGVLRRVSAIRDGWYRTQVNAITSLVLEISPGDEGAGCWRTLAQQPGFTGRARRIAFLLRNGRRRLVDRLVQAIAAAFGYL